MQGSLKFLIRPRTCLNLLGRYFYSDLLSVLCVINHSCSDFYLELTLGHSIALRRTFTGLTLAFVVACVSPVRRESTEQFSSTASSDTNREIYRSLVLTTRFRRHFPDLKESVLSLLPYTTGAISFAPQSLCRLLTRRLRSWGLGRGSLS